MKIEKVISEIKEVLKDFGEDEFEKLYSLIKKSERVFVCGAGRSGLIGRCFAMRLRHLGKESYVVGETICPPIKEKDLLIIISYSGEKKSIIPICEIAKDKKAKTLILTSSKDSYLSNIADEKIIFKKIKSLQFGNSSFEQAVFIFLESFVLYYMEKSKISEEFMKDRHTNLE